MSLLDLASLVLAPTATKEGKVYSAIPNTGDGDMTFSRGSAATRVNSAGLIEKVRTNLNTYSEDFSGVGGWAALFGATITATANYGTAPDGTTTSTRIVFSGASQIYSKTISGISGNIGVFSLWIKGTVGQTISITYGGASDKLVTLGSGWTRFATNGNSATNNTLYINTFQSSTARDFEVWGGQVEFGDVMTDYIPTTTTAVSVGITDDVPRVDYSGGGCPSLLLEKQSTNLVTYSEQFDNASWVEANSSVTTNQITSPDGYINADLLESTLTTEPRIRQTTTQTGSTAFTFSCFAKKGNVNFLILRNIAVNVAGGSRAWFNLDTGVVGTVNSGLTASMQNYGNGWYRCIITGTTDASPTNLVDIALSSIDNSFSGSDIGSNIYIWGAMLEAGSYSTSYIPTYSVSSTRVADSCSKTGISELIGQTEGTLFLEYDQKLINQGITRRIFALSDGTTSNRITAYINSANGIDFYVRNSGGDLFLDQASSPIGNTKGVHKIAAAYKNGDYAVYLDGVQIISGAGTAGTIPSCSRFDLGSQIGSNNLYEPMMQSLLFPTRLTNTELADLTTL